VFFFFLSFHSGARHSALRTDDRGAAFPSASNHHIEILQVT